MNIGICLIIFLMIMTSCGIANSARKTPKGAYVEESAENLTEAVIEAAAPVDVEIDFDPSGNYRPKCKKCTVHCPKQIGELP